MQTKLENCSSSVITDKVRVIKILRYPFIPTKLINVGRKEGRKEEEKEG